MTTGLVNRSRRTFENWHHEQCDGKECERAYCQTHRRLYWKCQDLISVSSRMYCDEPPFSTLWEGQGECVECLKNYETRKCLKWAEDHNKRFGKYG